MIVDDLFENVAGPEKCWPGYRKVGTKPGTGRNTGRRVNDCEKIKESVSEFQIGDPVIITGNVQYRGKTGDVQDIGRNGAFVVVNLYNYGPRSFHSTDVSYNDYADSDDEAEYQQGVAEGSDSEELANEVYREFERIYPNLARRADERTVHAAVMDVLNYGGDNNPAALAQDVARAVKRDIEQGVAEGVTQDFFNKNFSQIDSVIKQNPKKILDLLIGMFPNAKEAIVNQYNDEEGPPFAEWRRVIYDIDEYVLSGPVIVNGSRLPIDPESEADRLARYQQYIQDKDSGRPARYFRVNDSDPRTIDFSKLPPITIAQTDRGMEVTDGNHRAFLAKMANKPLRAYVWKRQSNNHPNAAKIKALFSNQQGVAEGSDISGLIAAASMVQDYIITAEVDGKVKKFRVRGMTGPRAAQERFLKHHSQARVIDVKPVAEKNVAEDSLEEIDRRGFLKGMGGAALAAAGVGAAAQTVSNPKEEARRIRDIADKFAMTNSAFRKEYQPVSDSYRNTAHKIMSSGKNYSPNSELARRQHAELIKLLRQEDKRFVEQVVPLLKKYQVTYEDVDIDEGWKQNLAALGVAGALGLGSVGPAQASTDPASDKIVATLVIDGEQRMLDLSSKNFSDVRAAEKFVREFMQQRGIDDYQYVIKGKGQTARCAGNCGLDFGNTREDVAEADTDKIGGRYDPEEFDQMMLRLKTLAGAGPLKTVWDPVKRVYRNVPINPQDRK